MYIENTYKYHAKKDYGSNENIVELNIDGNENIVELNIDGNISTMPLFK
jgi:hypothetical protein